MIWIVAYIVVLWSLWSFIRLLLHLFEGFKLDYCKIKEELLVEKSEPSYYQTISASINAFLHTIVRSPQNFFMVFGWIALGMLFFMVMEGLLWLLGILKDVLDFFLSGGRH